MLKAYVEFWTKIGALNAKASRKQFWVPFIVHSFILLILLISTHQVGSFIHGHGISLNPIIGYSDTLPSNILFFVIITVTLFVVLATFTSLCRRLHDAGFSGWWAVVDLLFIPFWWGLLILIIALLPSKEDPRWQTNQSDF